MNEVKYFKCVQIRFCSPWNTKGTPLQDSKVFSHSRGKLAIFRPAPKLEKTKSMHNFQFSLKQVERTSKLEKLPNLKKVLNKS